MRGSASSREGRTAASLAIVLALLACSADGLGGDGGTAAVTIAPGDDGSSGTAADDGDDAADDGATTSVDPSATTSGPGSTGDDGSTGPGADDTTGSADPPGRWLLTVDASASPPALMRVDLDAGIAALQCTFPAGFAYRLAFGRDGTLYGDHQTQHRLDEINPCNCGVQMIGATSTDALVLTLGADDDLRAIEPGLDAYLRVDPDTGLATVIGALGLDFVGAAAAWSEAEASVLAIDDAGDRLYAIDDATGLAGSEVVLSVDVTTPGLAVHPDGTTWVCSGDALYELDPATGMLTAAGTLALTGACDDLTAPTIAIACLE